MTFLIVDTPSRLSLRFRKTQQTLYSFWNWLVSWSRDFSAGISRRILPWIAIGAL